MGTADFLGVNLYTAYLAENSPSDITDVDYGADQDVYSYQDPTLYGFYMIKTMLLPWKFYFLNYVYRSGSSWLKVDPTGMRKLLNWLKDRFNNPEIIVTENGFSDNAGNLDDMQRV